MINVHALGPGPGEVDRVGLELSRSSAHPAPSWVLRRSCRSNSGRWARRPATSGIGALAAPPAANAQSSHSTTPWAFVTTRAEADGVNVRGAPSARAVACLPRRRSGSARERRHHDGRPMSLRHVSDFLCDGGFDRHCRGNRGSSVSMSSRGPAAETGGAIGEQLRARYPHAEGEQIPRPRVDRSLDVLRRHVTGNLPLERAPLIVLHSGARGLRDPEVDQLHDGRESETITFRRRDGSRWDDARAGWAGPPSRRFVKRSRGASQILVQDVLRGRDGKTGIGPVVAPAMLEHLAQILRPGESTP